MFMSVSHSRLTAQGQVSVPAEVRRALGLSPGSVLEWEQRGGQLVVRKAGRHTSADVHAALFGELPIRAAGNTSVGDTKAGIRAYIQGKHGTGGTASPRQARSRQGRGKRARG
jgi:AbrB family looped-hinge helix DNA binding protein